MNIFSKQTVNQYLHVLAVIFPLTLIVPMFMLPLLQLMQIAS
ncbi:hypothetical protein [Shewanella sp. UCD-KL21]|nr:hypothetical protein [Shewanella sp. UCD-KL21]